MGAKAGRVDQVLMSVLTLFQPLVSGGSGPWDCSALMRPELNVTEAKVLDLLYYTFTYGLRFSYCTPSHG